MEIGDEVTVTDFPLDHHYHDYSDHSYISTRAENSLPEFHELFDFGSDYPAFSFDLQEQVIESSKSEGIIINDVAQIDPNQSHIWIYPGDNYGESGFGNYEEDDNNSSGSEQDKLRNSTSVNNYNKNGASRQLSTHHTGPFPHSFISMAGDRRIRFCLGLQTIVTKIKALMCRTGATAEFKAEFENNVFTLDNADNMLALPYRSQNNKKTTGQCKNSSVQVDESITLSNLGGQDDHLYAATILTQTESSSAVRDHQYNEVTTTYCAGKKGTSEKTYIPTRYARERWLRKGATTIYTKIQRLINRTGAKMALSINYQGIIITPQNYKDLEQLLEKGRSKLKKYNTEVIVQNNKDDGEENGLSTGLRQGSSSTDKRVETVMKVSFPSNKAKNNSFKIEFLKLDGMAPVSTVDQTLSNVVESDHDYDNQSFQKEKRAKIIPSSNSADHISDNSSSSTQSHHGLHETIFSSISPSPSISDGETSGFGGYFASLFSSKPKTCSTLPVVKSSLHTADVSTSTDPCCGICGNSQISLSPKGKFPNWIRCAHTLCHYLVHPACIGFFITNSQHLQFLPPYFCPTHREDGFG